MGRIRSGAGRDDHSRRRAHDSPSTPALSRGAVARRSVPHMPTATTNANAKHGAISTRKQPCALLQYVTSLTSAEHNPQIPPRRHFCVSNFYDDATFPRDPGAAANAESAYNWPAVLLNSCPKTTKTFLARKGSNEIDDPHSGQPS